MRKNIELEEMKSIALDVLKFFRDICKENDIRYFLAYGTLLGAVRHKGFIPWDDDIDVFIPREDYYKLVKVMQENPHPYYELVSTETYSDFTAPLPKIVDRRTVLVQNYGFIEKVQLGIYIDLFILDGAGKSFEEAQQIVNNSYEIEKCWLFADSKMMQPNLNKVRSCLRWIKNIPYKIKGINYYLRKLMEENKKYLISESEYVKTIAFTTSPTRCFWKKEYFEETVQLEFEKELFNVPKAYHEMLTQEYGDYMTPPPENKRITHHEYEVYWKE